MQRRSSTAKQKPFRKLRAATRPKGRRHGWLHQAATQLLYSILLAGFALLLTLLLIVLTLLRMWLAEIHPWFGILTVILILVTYVGLPLVWVVYLVAQRRLRFSLRTLILSTGSMATLLAIVVPKIETMRSRSVIRALGGVVVTSPDAGLGRILLGTRHCAEALETSQPEIWLTHVTYVRLQSTDTDDADLVHLRSLTELEVLDLSRTKVVGPGLKHLQGLGRLESLSLTFTPITDNSLLHLRDIPNLEHLYLGGTRITDEAIQYLTQLDNLRVLDINWTMMTSAGIRELTTAMPKLEIMHEGFAAETSDHSLRRKLCMRPRPT